MRFRPSALVLLIAGCLTACVGRWSTSKGHYLFVPCRPDEQCLNLDSNIAGTRLFKDGDMRVTRAVITGNPTDESVWLTQTRVQHRWYTAPVGEHPYLMTFLTQAECEQFRAAHPSYTKPEERCRQLFVHRE
jgi:hypothetical protein